MRRILIIDDDELDPKPEGSVHAYDHVEALVALREGGHWHEVWLDHDLGEAGDSRKVAEFLEGQHEAGYPVNIDAIYVHSMNPPGAEELLKGLRKMYPTRRVPLPWTRTTRTGAPHAS